MRATRSARRAPERARRWTAMLVACGTVAGTACGAAADDPLAPAAAALAEQGAPAALDRLEELFATGYPTPSAVYADPRFAPLRATTETRTAWRELMRRHVRESRITMVPEDEEGRPMLVRGAVVRWPDGAPVAGAVVELSHTDASGRYEPVDSGPGRDRSARLFSLVRTDDEGRFEVVSIQPAPYPGGSPGAAHVHCRVRAPGFRPFGGDFRPYDHPREAARRASAVERGERVSTVRDEGRRLVVEVTIPLRPEASPG